MRFVIGAGALIEAALGDRTGGHELPPAFQLGLGQRDAGFFSGNLRFCLFDRCRIGLGIDGDEQVTLFHQSAFAEMGFQDGAADAWANFHPVNRFQTTGKFFPAHDASRFCLGDRYRHGRRWSGNIGCSIGLEVRRAEENGAAASCRQ
ncbi:hypothetical protein D9M69_593220 [compost metagenome]